MQGLSLWRRVAAVLFMVSLQILHAVDTALVPDSPLRARLARLGQTKS